MDRDLGFNIAVGAADSACFGLALGIASFTTVSPLFVQGLGATPLWVGLVAVLHPFGWHLTQLATARHVAGLPRYLPSVMVLTATERLPFFALAAVAAASSGWPRPVVLGLVMALLLSIGLGGGLTATAYQALVAHIMPPNRVGTFYGVKTAAANGAFVWGAIVAGNMLERLPHPAAFAWCYGLAGTATLVSWVLLGLTREQDDAVEGTTPNHRPANQEPEAIDARAAAEHPPGGGSERAARQSLSEHWRDAGSVWRWFIVARMLAQLAMLPAAFLTVYAVTRFGARPTTLGWMAAVFAASQTIGNPIMGVVGDRLGHRHVMAVGMVLAAVAALVARFSPSADGLFVAWALVGLANVACWTLPLAINLQLAGEGAQRPYRIGLANTVYAPSVLVAAVAGGVVAERMGYEWTFILAALGALAAAWVLVTRVSPGGPAVAT